MKRGPVAALPDSSPKHPHHNTAIGDFTAGPRTIALSLLAVVVGVLAAYVAKVLLALITFFTNLFYFQRISLAPVTPAGHHLGVLSVLVPVIGCLIIGILARYGSERSVATESPRRWRRS